MHDERLCFGEIMYLDFIAISLFLPDNSGLAVESRKIHAVMHGGVGSKPYPVTLVEDLEITGYAHRTLLAFRP